MHICTVSLSATGVHRLHGRGRSKRQGGKEGKRDGDWEGGEMLGKFTLLWTACKSNNTCPADLALDDNHNHANSHGVLYNQ